MSEIIKPLIDDGVLKIERAENVYKVIKIEGSFDYQKTKNVLFNALSIVRNHIERINNYSYFHLLKSRSLFKELDDEIYLMDRLISAFLQALSLTSAPNLNTKQMWQIETQFLVENHNIITKSANNLFQNINEYHVRSTILLALVAIIISAISLIC